MVFDLKDKSISVQSISDLVIVLYFNTTEDRKWGIFTLSGPYA